MEASDSEQVIEASFQPAQIPNIPVLLCIISKIRLVLDHPFSPWTMFGSVGSAVSQGPLRKQGDEAPRWGGWLGSIKEIQQKLLKFLRAVKIREIPALVALARGAEQLLGLERLVVAVAEKVWGNTTTASVWNTGKELEEYACLLSHPTPSSLARGPGNQSAREPEWFGPCRSAWGQAVWMELRPAGIPGKWGVKEWSWHPWSLMSPWDEPPWKGPWFMQEGIWEHVE